MDADSADGIIDVELHVEDFDDDHDEDTGYDTDDRRADRVKGVAAGGHTDQASKRGVQTH